MRPQVLHGSAAYRGPRPVLTIGNFDGVHLGHQELLRRVVAEGRRLDAPPCVYTFDPPPRAVLQPGRRPPQIMTVEERLERLGAAGVMVVIVEAFTRAFSRHPPSWFAEEVLGRRLRPRSLVVGHDFRFGRGRAGDAAVLCALMPDLPLTQVAPVTVPVEGEAVRVSSSRVREWVAQGRVAHAAALLGRPHRVWGRVVPGDGRGRTIGVPTANLEVDGELLPARGVYAVTATLPDGSEALAVANIGSRPTFTEAAGYVLEVHLLDRQVDLYGQRLGVSFRARLRGERRFEGVDALVAQIRADVERARDLLAS